jgi:CubicO group peptidase (beta-lactamase class C family)
VTDPVAALAKLREDPYVHTAAFVVVRAGETIAAHALGRPLDQPADIYSMTKSVLSTVAAIAVRDGDLDLDASLGELLGARVRPDRAAATVRHLLEMTGGAHAEDPIADMDAIRELPSGWVDSLLSRPAGTPPGSTFCYDNGSAHELAAAMTAALGDVAGHADRQLFRPLGIDRWHWPRDPEGVPWGDGGLELSALAMARLGEAWRTDELALGPLLTEATTARSPGGPPEHRPYGRLFWIDEVAGLPAFFAGGYAGQHTLVVPAAGLTPVTTGEESRLLPDWRWRPGIEVTRELAARLLPG